MQWQLLLMVAVIVVQLPRVNVANTIQTNVKLLHDLKDKISK